MSHEGYHEPIEELSDETRDMHRAIESLKEELEAIDWYNQRVDACKDPELKKELTCVEYDFTDKGRIRLDRKADIMDEYGFSPDRADALSM